MITLIQVLLIQMTKGGAVLGQRGYTLLEMLITLALLGMLVALLLPLFTPMYDYQEWEGYAKQFEADFLLAQQKALTGGKHYQIVFDVIQNRYTVKDFSNQEKAIIRQLPKEIKMSATLAHLRYYIDFKSNSVTAGSIIFEHTKKEIGKRFIIQVNTGRIRVEDI